MDSWPNQEALNKALNIYRTYMRAFIIFHLKKVPGEKVEDVVMNSLDKANQYDRAGEIERELKKSDRDIKSIIDVSDFPHLIQQNWGLIFEEPLKDDKEFWNQLWLIKTRRDKDVAHPPEEDAECESTRVHMFLIAEVLRKINRPDKQREVEKIRDELFSDDTVERLAKAEADLKVTKAKNAEYKKSVAEAKKSLEDAESEKSEYEKDNTSLSNQVKKLSKQLKTAKTGRDNHKKNLSRTKKLLDKSEAAKADYKERLENTSKELKKTETEQRTSAERLVETSNQLAQVQEEKKGIVKRLASMQALFTTATLDKPEIRSIFPALDTDTSVRILDRRGTDKRNYLLGLLEQKQPIIIYVQNEEKIDLLFNPRFARESRCYWKTRCTDL